MRRKTKRRKLPVRIPTPKPTEWHRDKKRYTRKRKHKEDIRNGRNEPNY